MLDDKDVFEKPEVTYRLMVKRARRREQKLRSAEIKRQEEIAKRYERFVALTKGGL